ncbi:unnamed protein product [Urochloa decumbens]|uniref:F-box domain-containing protein n=1 Tax=Urochloa decumbens TaxID=240449 RepID=A0ABC9D792_9POAL
MPPPARPLPDDLIPDILVRLASDDPAGIIRAAAVCKAWRRILADPAFAARYCALHPSPPVLGFLHRPPDLQIAQFVPTPTTSFRPSPSAVQRSRHPLDCRHGRALFYDYGSLDSFIVWDPITAAVHKIPPVPDVFTQPAVLCAAGAGCDDHHRGCGGGKPFIVAFAGVENIPEDYCFDAHACYWASDTGEWSVHINIHLDHGRYRLTDRPAALVGDALYFVGKSGFLLRYRYGLLRRVGRRSILSAGIREADVLSVIEPPQGKRLGTVFVMAAEGGGLGLASMNKNSSRLYLWAREAVAAGIAGDDGRWVQRRIIDLNKLLPGGNPGSRPCLSGVGEDGSVIFVSTDDGVFTVELESSKVKKVCSEMGKVDLVLPFMSFYTHSLLLKLASGNLASAPAENQ